MAYLWRKSSKKGSVWFVQYRDEAGKRVSRSTHKIDRKEAQRVAEELEGAASLARRKQLTHADGTRILAKMVKASNGGTFEAPTIKEAFEKWLESRAGRNLKMGSIKRYEGIIKGLFTFLGEERIKAPVTTLDTVELEKWHHAEMKAGKGGTTADLGITVVRMGLKWLFGKRFIEYNPALGVEGSGMGGEKRETFTDREVKSLLATCDMEWRGMILFSAWHSLRLQDAAGLTWGNVDIERGILSYIPTKTRRKNPEPLIRIMPPDVIGYLASLDRGVGLAPIFPKLHGRSSGSHAGLSNEFGRLMVKAGVEVSLGQVKEGKGRRFRKKGFHSFRHFSISRMLETNIPDEQRRMLAGHKDDSEAHRNYLHLSEKAQKKALSKLPRLTSKPQS
jgi:integrase